MKSVKVKLPLELELEYFNTKYQDPTKPPIGIRIRHKATNSLIITGTGNTRVQNKTLAINNLFSSIKIKKWIVEKIDDAIIKIIDKELK